MRNVSKLPQGSFGIPGLSHTTLAGSVLHGMKEARHYFVGIFTACFTSQVLKFLQHVLHLKVVLLPLPLSLLKFDQ